LIPKLYNIGIKAYGQLVRLVAIRNNKAKLWIEGRKKSFDYLSKNISVNDQIIWVHCPSLGEFEQGRPLIESIKKQYPKYKILLTFYSPSGYEVRKDYPLADFVCYLPLDSKKNADRFVKMVKPAFTFFVKYDFWPNYLRALQEANHKHYVISAIFRSEQYFFKKYGAWMLDYLKNVSHFFVQNEDSKYMLLSEGVKAVTKTGDTRFDRVLSIVEDCKELPIVENFKGESPLFIAGSTWPQGEEMLVELIKHYGDRFKYIIAPHEIHETQIEKLVNQIDLNCLRYSQADAQSAQTAQVLIIDNIGLLSSLYAYGDVAYIGGGFGKGIHNTLEAATFGMPIFIGPNHEKFQEALELKSKGVAIEVSSAQSMIAYCDRLFTHRDKWDELKAKSTSYVQNQAGATQKIINHVFGS